ncbi:hypothetical protein AAA426_03255 [Lactobacillus crispatus]|uniref:hypothetical protein n=1 Tax=Lactobacillus crispatus TaxID=47770 RepID=UPI0011D29E04|nr:hypothetical protein [Lactobacillus crispatus]MCT3537097.1 hypothetical protein [Lactobacillus crispatus]
MKTKNLFTSLAAAVMLSAGLAGAGVSAAEPVHAATTQTSNQKGTISFKRRSVSATVNSDNPKLIAVNPQTNKIVKTIDSNYTKGQAIQVYFSTEATNNQGAITLYYVDGKTVDGQQCQIYILSTDVTPSATVPNLEDWSKQAQSDQKAIQDAYNNRALKYIVVSPKSKKGAKIYYAYKKSAKAKKVYFKATKKKIKYGKKYKSSMIVKNGKSRYAYIGKKRYLKTSTIKVVSVKYAPVQLSDDLKNLIVQN